MASLLTRARNSICFNELYYDVQSLPLFFAWMRWRIRLGMNVPHRADQEGNLITSLTPKKRATLRWLPARAEDDLILGSNVNTVYLDEIKVLLDYEYPIVVIIRDPVFTLGSWNTSKLSDAPMQAVIGEGMRDRWKKRPIEFETSTTVRRQAEIWEHYAQLIASHRERLLLVRYEDLTEEPGLFREQVSQELGLDFDEGWDGLRNMNNPGRYGGLEEIRTAVEDLCPTRTEFGYG